MFRQEHPPLFTQTLPLLCNCCCFPVQERVVDGKIDLYRWAVKIPGDLVTARGTINISFFLKLEFCAHEFKTSKHFWQQKKKSRSVSTEFSKTKERSFSIQSWKVLTNLLCQYCQIFCNIKKKMNLQLCSGRKIYFKTCGEHIEEHAVHIYILGCQFVNRWLRPQAVK